MTRPPAPRPCESCPYRRDVPSGVWAVSEYVRLLDYDRPTALQPAGVFLCHQADGRVCAGWAGCHGRQDGEYDLLALRLPWGRDLAEAVRGYQSPVRLFTSAAEAVIHGLREVAQPGDAARRLIRKYTDRE